MSEQATWEQIRNFQNGLKPDGSPRKEVKEVAVEQVNTDGQEGFVVETNKDIVKQPAKRGRKPKSQGE